MDYQQLAALSRQGAFGVSVASAGSDLGGAGFGFSGLPQIIFFSKFGTVDVTAVNVLYLTTYIPLM